MPNDHSEMKAMQALLGIKAKPGTKVKEEKKGAKPKAKAKSKAKAKGKAAAPKKGARGRKKKDDSEDEAEDMVRCNCSRDDINSTLFAE